MPRRLFGVMMILLVSAVGWAQGESVLSQEFAEKIALAEKKGLDTLPEFRMQLDYYSRNLLQKIPKNEEKTVAQRSEWVKLASITRRLPQQVDRDELKSEMLRMEAIYTELKNGADFETVARLYALEGGGGQRWIPMPYLSQEWKNCLFSLKNNEISRPFLSPVGIHMIYWTEKGYRDERIDEKAVITNREEAKKLRDYLLVAILEKKYRKPLAYTEKDLERYYDLHRADYAWELPHYRGAVVHCRDKKEAKRIKKQLKKHRFVEWKRVLSEVNSVLSDSACIEIGIFQIGTNQYIDKLVFGCGDYKPVEEYPYTFVVGKKLKKGPDSYLDVLEKVREDYLKAHRNDWLNDLR